MEPDDPFIDKLDDSKPSPWDVNSFYQFQFFVCPGCVFQVNVFQVNSKQDFLNHVHDEHIEAEEYLCKIQDGSLSDVFCPWDSKEAVIKGGRTF